MLEPKVLGASVVSRTASSSAPRTALTTPCCLCLLLTWCFLPPARPSTLLCDAGLSATTFPRLLGQLAVSSSRNSSGQKEGRKRREGSPFAAGSCWKPSSSSSGSTTFLDSQHKALCPSRGCLNQRGAPCHWSLHQPHVACPPSSYWALGISLLFLYPSPRGRGFLMTLISQLPHFSIPASLAF